VARATEPIAGGQCGTAAARSFISVETRHFAMEQLWGEQYHRELSDLLAVQSEFAREVSSGCVSQLSAGTKKVTKARLTSEPIASNLKGQVYTDKFTKEGFETGIDDFNQAIAVDPTMDWPTAVWPTTTLTRSIGHWLPAKRGPKQKLLQRRRWRSTRRDARAHLTLAIETHWYEWKWAVAESEFNELLN